VVLAVSVVISMLKNQCSPRTSYVQRRKQAYYVRWGSWMYVVTQRVAMYVVMAALNKGRGSPQSKQNHPACQKIVFK
jgi:hypothetical protein